MAKWTIYEIESTKSTNDEALSYKEEGAVILAKKQTKGRGRLGHSWESKEGNLYCSAVVGAEFIPFLPALSFVTAISLGDTLSKLCNRLSYPKQSLSYKWPNDVMLDGKKTAGILLEVADEPKRVIIGLGVNLISHPKDEDFPERTYKTTCLSEFGINTTPKETLSLFLEHFSCNLEVLRKEGFPPIREAWLSKAEKIGQNITVRLAKSTISGVFKNIDEQGSIILFLPEQGKELIIPAGEVL